jgi:hypothetical protein
MQHTSRHWIHIRKQVGFLDSRRAGPDEDCGVNTAWLGQQQGWVAGSLQRK